MTDYLNVIKYTNCSALFLPQTVGVTSQNRHDFTFVNSYLYDESRPEYGEGHIIIVFKPQNKKSFENYVGNEVFRNENFLENYSLDEFEIMIYKIPEKYKNDLELFKQGKYSEFSKEIRQLYPKMVITVIGGVRRDALSVSHLIINKDKSLKEYWEKRLDEEIEGEVWPIYNKEKETFKVYESVTESDRKSETV